MQDILFGGSQFTRAAKNIQHSHFTTLLVDECIKRQAASNKIKFQYQASVKLAKLHQQAIKFGANPSNPTNAKQRILCACCNHQVSHDSLGICFSTTDVSQLEVDEYAEFQIDSGIAMLFSFMKMLILYFFIRAIVVDGFNLATNIMFGTTCNQEQNCEKIFWNFISTSNKQSRKDLLFILDILNLAFVVISIIFFFYYRKSQYYLYDTIDGKTQTEDDYTIMVSNIPVLDFPKKNEQNDNEVQFFHRKHLWEFFEQKVFAWLNQHKNWEKPSPGTIEYHLNSLKHDQNNGQLRSQDIVKSISLCYDLSRLEKIHNQRQKLIDQFLDNKCQQLDKEQDKHSGRFSTTPKKVEFLNDCELTVNKEFATNNSVLFNMTHFVGHAFVSFEYQHFREFIIQQAQKDKNFLNYRGTKLVVRKASHPSDIFWQNLRIQDRFSRVFKTYFILFMILLFSFVLIVILQSFKEKLSNIFISSQSSQPLNFVTFISTNWPMVLIAIFIIIINQILNKFIHSLTAYEKHETKSDEKISLIIKLVIFEFINTALIYFFVQLIKSDDTFMERTGLIIQVSWLIVFNIVYILFFKIINFGDLLKRFKKCWKYRNLLDQDTVKTFQTRLNRQYQYPEFEIVQVYSELLVHIYTISFYAFLIPIGPISCFIYFSLYFWIVKCNLFKRSSLYFTFDFVLSRSVLKMFEISILIFAIGNFLIAIQQWKIELINFILKTVTFGIALIYSLFIFFAPESLERKILGRYQTFERPTYDDAKGGGRFEQTYWTQNPATRLIKQQTITKKIGIVNPLKEIVFANPQMLLLQE